MESLTLPPLHPALVHFPIALITVSFFTDLIARLTGSPSLRTAGWWMLVAGTICTLITVPLGYFDMNRATLDARTHEFVDLHLRIGWLLLICVILLVMRRAYFRSHPEKWVGSGYLFVAFLVTILVLFQGWYGGEMVYSHGAGVSAAGQGTESMAVARRPLENVSRVLARIPGFRYSADDHHHEAEPAGAQPEHHHDLD